MRIAVYGRRTALDNIDTVTNFIGLLLKGNAQVCVYTHIADAVKELFTNADIGTFDNHTELQNVDALVSFGGDGTLLDTTTFVRNSQIPILGINTGRLGFLTGYGKDEISEAANALLSGNYIIDKRAVLKVESNETGFDGYPYALNELTVHKKDTSSMITVDVYLNDAFLNSYWADGLIISTPTGSTAYSLSCEGPILTPDSQNFIINPIAPHNLNVRPLVIPDDVELKLVVESRSNDFLASLDSRSQSISTQLALTITKAPFSINLIRRPGQDFLATLRQKLFWGSDKRN